MGNLWEDYFCPSGGRGGFLRGNLLFICYNYRMNNNERIDWHIAFIKALQLDFSDYSGILEIKDNVFLTAEPLEIDAVIIKKEPNAVIRKHIADIFETDNIIAGTSKYSFAAILHCLLPHLFGSNAQQNSILLALFAFNLRQNPTQSCVPLVFRGALSTKTRRFFFR
ncbi:MAG: hypothetical protein Ta2B_30070 [Termitinemataceae bacterium]|nr:MAG: hypothetical protein Ta2B_30070 [Termitinemataceae bacterium]